MPHSAIDLTDCGRGRGPRISRIYGLRQKMKSSFLSLQSVESVKSVVFLSLEWIVSFLMSVGYPNGGGGFLWAGRPNNGLERDAPAAHLICAHRRLPFFLPAQRAFGTPKCMIRHSFVTDRLRRGRFFHCLGAWIFATCLFGSRSARRSYGVAGSLCCWSLPSRQPSHRRRMTRCPGWWNSIYLHEDASYATPDPISLQHHPASFP